VVVVVVFFAVRVKLPAGGNLSLWVYGTACEMLKIGPPLMTYLACRLPPTRDSLDHGRGKCDAG
jgi:hypothetical protein